MISTVIIIIAYVSPASLLLLLQLPYLFYLYFHILTSSNVSVFKLSLSSGTEFRHRPPLPVSGYEREYAFYLEASRLLGVCANNRALKVLNCHKVFRNTDVG